MRDSAGVAVAPVLVGVKSQRCELEQMDIGDAQRRGLQGSNPVLGNSLNRCGVDTLPSQLACCTHAWSGRQLEGEVHFDSVGLTSE